MRTSEISTVHASTTPTTTKAAPAASGSDGKFHAELGKARSHASNGAAKPARAKAASGGKKAAKGATGRQSQAVKAQAGNKGEATTETEETSSDEETEQSASAALAKGKASSADKNAAGKNIKITEAPTAKSITPGDDAEEGKAAEEGQRWEGQKQSPEQTADETGDMPADSGGDEPKNNAATTAGNTNNPVSMVGWMGMTLNSANGLPKASPRADAANESGTDASDASANVSAVQTTAAGSLPGLDSSGADLAATEDDSTDGSGGIAADLHADKAGVQIHGQVTPNGVSFAALVQNSAPGDSGAASGKSVSASAAHTGAAQTASTPETQFASTNHGNIVSGVRGQLLPNGGSMQIRLDPPELGALQVSVKMENGVLSASFQTSSDEATKLLSHSLGQLKQTLEAQGVSVDRLHVQQAPKGETTGNNTSDDSSQQQGQAQERGQQQDQQRREMLRRMWAQVAGGDPLDLVA